MVGSSTRVTEPSVDPEPKVRASVSVLHVMAIRPPEYRREFIEAVSKQVNFHISCPAEEAGLGFTSAQLGSEVQVIEYAEFQRFGLRLKRWRENGFLPDRFDAHDAVVIQDAIADATGWLILVRQKLRRQGPAVISFGFGSRGFESKSRLRQWASSWRFRLADAGLVYTAAGHDGLRAAGVSTQISVLYNATNTEALRAALAQRPARSGPTDGVIRLLYIGRLVPEKGVDDLCEVALALGSNGIVRVVGSGPLESSLAARRIPNLELLGERSSADELANALSWADAVILPGRVGLTVVDAFVAGKPVIARSSNPHSEQSPEFDYLEHGVNALLVSVPKGQTFGQAVDELLLGSDVTALCAGAVRSGSVLSSQKMADTYVAMIERAVASRRSRQRRRARLFGSR